MAKSRPIRYRVTVKGPYNNRRSERVSITDELEFRIVRALTARNIQPSSDLVRQLKEYITSEGVNDYMNRRKVRGEMICEDIRRLGLRFPNPVTGNSYNERIDITFKDLGLAGFIAVLPEDSGLTAQADEEGVTVSGVPGIPGEYKLKILGYIDNELSEPDVQVEIPIFINADPSKMWNDIPTPKDIQFYKPDNVCGAASFEDDGKRLIAASRRGRSHAHDGIPRDDDFALRVDSGTGWYAVAVADGAGSAKFSRRGSQIACETSIKVIFDYLGTHHTELEDAAEAYAESRNREDAKRVADCLHASLTKGAFESNRALNSEADGCLAAKVQDFHTTLLTAVACRLKSGVWFIGTYWVGDGAIALLTDEGVKIMGDPDGGQFAGETRFLTMNSIFTDRQRTRFAIVPDFKALILMTDGVSDPRFESDADLKETACWEALWKEISDNVDLNATDADSQLLEWLNFYTKGHHDDRTIAILS